MKQIPLLPGDQIGVMAPSSHVERADIEASVAALETRGYRVFIHPQTYAREGQSAGDHAEKVAALHDLWRDPGVQAIWAAGGGNRALHILDALDYDLIKENPKPFIGFSDVTALLNALYVQAGQVCFHAPVFRQLHRSERLDHVLGLLAGEADALSMPLDQANIVREGQAKGCLIGGNLSLFQYLPQTLSGNFWSGAILCLEDCNEELSRLDRMFLHLKRLGVLAEISGLVLGKFTELKDSATPFGHSLEEILTEHTEGLDIPIIMDAPFGHSDQNHAFPIGEMAEIDTANRIFKFL